jgi:phosphoribosylanthranilate isomerase
LNSPIYQKTQKYSYKFNLGFIIEDKPANLKEANMKTQIYTMQSIEEAKEVVALGVNQIGLTPSSIGLPGEIDFSTARAIVDAIGGSAVCVALTVSIEIDEIIEMVKAVQPDILHLCPLENLFPPEAVKILRGRIPNMPIMQAISVANHNAVEVAISFQAVADYLILDTQAADIDGIGASGETHDWSISQKIVEQSKIPVILAGGLSPENVEEAIRIVKPWAVDSLTHTNFPLADGEFRKDLNKVKDFVNNAHYVK